MIKLVTGSDPSIRNNSLLIAKAITEEFHVLCLTSDVEEYNNLQPDQLYKEANIIHGDIY